MMVFMVLICSMSLDAAYAGDYYRQPKPNYQVPQPQPRDPLSWTDRFEKQGQPQPQPQPRDPLSWTDRFEKPERPQHTPQYPPVQAREPSRTPPSVQPIIGVLKFKRDDKGRIKTYTIKSEQVGKKGEKFDRSIVRKFLTLEGPDRKVYAIYDPSKDSRPLDSFLMKKFNVTFTDYFDQKMVKFKPTGKFTEIEGVKYPIADIVP